MNKKVAMLVAGESDEEKTRFVKLLEQLSLSGSILVCVCVYRVQAGQKRVH